MKRLIQYLILFAISIGVAFPMTIQAEDFTINYALNVNNVHQSIRRVIVLCSIRTNNPSVRILRVDYNAQRMFFDRPSTGWPEVQSIPPGPYQMRFNLEDNEDPRTATDFFCNLRATVENSTGGVLKTSGFSPGAVENGLKCELGQCTVRLDGEF